MFAFGGNSLLQWSIALGVGFGSMLLLRFVRVLVVSRIGKLAAATQQTKIDDIVAKALAKTKWFTYLGVGLYLGSNAVTLPSRASNGLRQLASLLLLLQAGLWLQTVVRESVAVWKEQEGESPSRHTMAAAIAFILRLLIWSLVLLLALSNVGFEISALVAGLGVGGLRLRLRFKMSLGICSPLSLSTSTALSTSAISLSWMNTSGQLIELACGLLVYDPSGGSKLF